MKYTQRVLIGLAFSFTITAVAVAQGGGGPRSGMGPNNTSGWSMMSKAERDEHHRMMQSMKTYEECLAYMEKHHAQMVDRAKERKRAIPSKPRHDACVMLKK